LATPLLIKHKTVVKALPEFSFFHSFQIELDSGG